jgi:hypothetical protein
MVRSSRLQAAVSLIDGVEPEASDAAIGGSGWLHTRGSGRYPKASDGPDPSHLSETGVLGTWW